MNKREGFSVLDELREMHDKAWKSYAKNYEKDFIEEMKMHGAAGLTRTTSEIYVADDCMDSMRYWVMGATRMGREYRSREIQSECEYMGTRKYYKGFFATLEEDSYKEARDDEIAEWTGQQVDEGKTAMGLDPSLQSPPNKGPGDMPWIILGDPPTKSPPEEFGTVTAGEAEQHNKALAEELEATPKTPPGECHCPFINLNHDADCSYVLSKMKKKQGEKQ